MHYDECSHSVKYEVGGCNYSVAMGTLQLADVIPCRYFVRDAFVTFWKEVDAFTFHCFSDKAREGDQYAMVAP